MAEILNRGMMLITQNLALNVATHIDKMVLAYKPGLNYTDPVNPDEPDPAPGEIKYRGPVTKAAAISPDTCSDTSTVLLSFVNARWLGMAESGRRFATVKLPAPP